MIPIYQVDAFTQGPFSGNPAAVCPLDDWLDDATLLSIAAENNLSETAFIVPNDSGTIFAGSLPRSKSTSAATQRWPLLTSSLTTSSRVSTRLRSRP